MAGPLQGIKVLSFARALAGPYASMLLCDLGAEVIKIEAPERGDTTRRLGPYVKGIGSYFLSINRGKKSITLNLRNEQAKELVFELAKRVDILIENFRPWVMARLGLHYEAIREHNPRIIYASISGFGQKGPYSLRPAYDMIAQGMGGVVSITGEPGKTPVRVGYSIGDLGCSLFAAAAILAALHEREKSGEGQWIDVSMLDCQVALCENACARYFATGDIPGPVGSRHPLFTPFQIFPTKDGSIVLIAYRKEEWERFCKAVGKEEWINDEQFKTNQARLQNYSSYEGAMDKLMRTRTTAEWIRLFNDHDVMCAPVNNIEDVVHDPHVLERDMIVEAHHPRVGRLKVVGTPMKFSRTPCRIEGACPDLGEHTVEVLSDLLGLTEEEIRGLRETNVI
jgi:CoA:oxalate CoA-transferase